MSLFLSLRAGTFGAPAVVINNACFASFCKGKLQQKIQFWKGLPFFPYHDDYWQMLAREEDVSNVPGKDERGWMEISYASLCVLSEETNELNQS